LQAEMLGAVVGWKPNWTIAEVWIDPWRLLPEKT
jgi:hypothetical protein